MEHLYFDDVSRAFRDGQITDEHVNGWMDELDLETEAREARWNSVHGADGALVQFQVVALHRSAKDEAQRKRMAAEPPPPSGPGSPVSSVPLPTTPVPEELMRDVPEPVYDEPLPDLAAEIKKRLGIIAAVRMFGKAQDRIRDTRTEGIKVRCPFHSHTDNDPSAWCNTEKNAWYCGVCGVGGDVIDFYAARKHGLRPDDYHRSPRFNEIVRELGAEIGLSVVRRGKTYEIEDERAPLPSPLPDASGEESASPARGVAAEADEPRSEDVLTEAEPVVPSSPEAAEPITVTVDDVLRGVVLDEDIRGEPEEEDDDPTVPMLDWHRLEINPGSFLGQWMESGEVFRPSVPPEFYWAMGIEAVALACGHSVTSVTGGDPLNGQMLVLLVGSSGGGKTTAVGDLKRMLRRVDGPKFDRTLGTGVKVLPSPGSSEALIQSIYTEIEDPAPPPTAPAGAMMEVGATAWLYEDEFATLVERSSRKGGGAIKSRLIELSDFCKRSDTPELVIEEYALSSDRQLHDSYFCAVFTTQTDAIRALMHRNDLINGFINRQMIVMGRSRQERKMKTALTLPMAPDYDIAYKHLWDRCRSKHFIIPFTDEALDLLDEHPFLRYVKNRADGDSLYSRVIHMTVRVAMLLAINNNDKEVGIKNVNSVIEVFSRYLMKCFEHLRAAVVATEQDDAAAHIETYIKRYYLNHKGRWPMMSQWAGDRSYKSYDSETRLRALDVLFRENRAARIKLRAENGREQIILMVPKDDWASYANSHDKKYNVEDFYKDKA